MDTEVADTPNAVKNGLLASNGGDLGSIRIIRALIGSASQCFLGLSSWPDNDTCEKIWDICPGKYRNEAEVKKRSFVEGCFRGLGLRPEGAGFDSIMDLISDEKITVRNMIHPLKNIYVDLHKM